jgi:hypothetical protein
MIENQHRKTINGLAITYRAVDSLRPYEHNPRTHSDAQIDVLVESLKEFDWTNPILLDGKNGIIAGEGRWLAAKKLGIMMVPCIDLSHLTPTQRKAYVIADNQTALLAGWDDELLRLELEALKLEGLDIGLLGFDDAELARILDKRSIGATDPDDVPPVPANPVARTGDLWELGPNLLLCGDATNKGDVARTCQRSATPLALWLPRMPRFQLRTSRISEDGGRQLVVNCAVSDWPGAQPVYLQLRTLISVEAA